MTTSSATWEEIKRLAADFQRMQLLECTNKLSERNCIEIVNKLSSLGLLDIVHSLDGKEYVTKQQIEKEIYDNLYFNFGRLSITYLQGLLNLDISHIESAIAEITQHDTNVIYVAGQIINREYLNKMAEDISDLLLEKGILLISEISNTYSLPLEFLQQTLKDYVGNIIRGYMNDSSLYTQSYIFNQRSLLVGALEASIKPIRLSQIKKEYSINMLNNLLDDLFKDSELSGSFFGGKQESCVFLPDTYTTVQRKYIESFYKQNGYIDYASLRKLGVTEPESYVKNLLSNEKNRNIEYFTSCCMGEYMLDQIENNLDDYLTTSGYSDLISLLPSSTDSKDYPKIANYFQRKLKSKTEYTVFTLADTFFLTQQHLKQLYDYFDKKMESNAREDMKNPNILLTLRLLMTNDDSPSSSNTATSSKSGKGKSKGAKNTESKKDMFADSMVDISFIDETSLEKELNAKHDQISVEHIQALVEHMLKPLNQRYMERLKNKMETLSQQTSIENNSSNTAGNTKSEIVTKKSLIKTTQEKMKTFVINSRIFLKAIKNFNNEKCQDLLGKHLVKTLFNEMLNELIKYSVEEQLVSFDCTNLNNDLRNKVLQKLKDPHKTRLIELNSIMDKKSCFDLIDLIEKACNDLLELQFKKLDNKKEKEVSQEMRDALCKSFESETDAAILLQLASIILYYDSTGNMLNLPGRCVPDVLDVLKSYITEDSHKKLIEFQSVVLKQLTKSNDEINENIEDNIKNIKQIVMDKTILVKK